MEEKEATIVEKAINEINSGIYIFDRAKLFEALALLRPNNAQGEYYLTDVFEHFWINHWRVSALQAHDAAEVLGVNTLDQLADARALLGARGEL